MREASAYAGMRCQRADDIWKNEHILDDVLELIWTARVVVADLTDRNANVFYETGIAHTIGRDVVLTTQNMEHVPFDLRSIRALTYYPNREGLAALKDGLRARLETLIKPRSAFAARLEDVMGAAPRRNGLSGTGGQRWPRTLP